MPPLACIGQLIIFYYIVTVLYNRYNTENNKHDVLKKRNRKTTDIHEKMRK